MKYASSEEHRRRNAENGLIRKFGMTLSDRDKMLAEQGGVCAMCGSDNPRSKRAWHVDHDHATGRIRGILCFPCNTKLGHYERLRDEVGHGTIARYITENRPTPTAHSEAI